MNVPDFKRYDKRSFKVEAKMQPEYDITEKARSLVSKRLSRGYVKMGLFKSREEPKQVESYPENYSLQSIERGLNLLS